MHALRPRLLVVDDDRAILTLVGSIALSEGFDVATTVDGHEALRHLASHPADLALVDLRMPGIPGLDVLRAAGERCPRTRVVLMSGHATIDSAVEAVKLGAEDYLTKPIDLARLRHLFEDVRQDAEHRRAVQALDGELADRLSFHGMIGRGPAMQEVFGLVRRLAPHARTVLVTGETGTGKELVARALHALGPRSSQTLLTVNCSGVVETLSESELFGHARGAFTGAGDARPGLFEAASGGTLFLDEIGELPLAVQAKLLRVIENGEVQRVGSVETRAVDVRIVAATNRDLLAAVAAGRFRSDLFYRLNVAEVTLPPLRDRREDIPYLTAAFIRELGARFGKPLTGVTPGAARLLAEAEWDGNVRHLRNVLERSCMLADGDAVSEADLRQAIGGSGRVVPPVPAPIIRAARPLQAVEREHIVSTLEQVHGNKAVAARLLGLSRRALYRQLERHGLHRRVPAVRASLAVPVEEAS